MNWSKCWTKNLEHLVRNNLYFFCAGPYKMLKKLHKTLTAKSNQDIVLISNVMFSKNGFPMNDAFVKTNKANFQCESRSLDFSNPQGAADIINTWVSNKTKGRKWGFTVHGSCIVIVFVAWLIFCTDAVVLLPHVGY